MIKLLILVGIWFINYRYKNGEKTIIMGNIITKDKLKLLKIEL